MTDSIASQDRIPVDLKEGDTAPDFTLPTSGGGSISLHDFRGRTVILYFYPKDDTSGCTREACDFRDILPQIEVANAVVLGISPDSVNSHDRFTAKYGLTFPLLADPDHRVAEQFGVWKERSMYGKRYMGIERTTFLIDPDARIEKIWRKVKVPNHVAEVLASLS